MAKELYLYSTIYDFVAERLIAEMEAVKGEDITLRVNTPGGNIFAGWGIIAKMQEHEGKVKIKADGMAGSFGLYMLAFADEVEALDMTTGLLHRADVPVDGNRDQQRGLGRDLVLTPDPCSARLIKKLAVDTSWNGRDWLADAIGLQFPLDAVGWANDLGGRITEQGR